MVLNNEVWCVHASRRIRIPDPNLRVTRSRLSTPTIEPVLLITCSRSNAPTHDSNSGSTQGQPTAPPFGPNSRSAHSWSNAPTLSRTRRVRTPELNSRNTRSRPSAPRRTYTRTERDSGASFSTPEPPPDAAVAANPAAPSCKICGQMHHYSPVYTPILTGM